MLIPERSRISVAVYLIRMCKCTHDHHRMVKETNKTIKFQAHVFYYTFL